MKIYEGFYHEIFNDPERQQVFGDMEVWLNARL
jgi:alpha-beta hydrolase superfamily lysophospholipase